METHFWNSHQNLYGSIVLRNTFSEDFVPLCLGELEKRRFRRETPHTDMWANESRSFVRMRNDILTHMCNY